MDKNSRNVKDLLVIITARGGSKGIPGKNIKSLCGKPLLCYSIDAARAVAPDERICLTTDSLEIARVAEEYGLSVPFMRPAELATDSASSDAVLKHALAWYEERGMHVDAVLHLQPTSPYRTRQHLEEAIAMYDDSVDMVVSVNDAAANPYYDCYEENEEGWLKLSKGEIRPTRRQVAPCVWQTNGSIYVINPASLRSMPMTSFKHLRKYVMDKLYSVDLDTLVDWKLAEILKNENLVETV